MNTIVNNAREIDVYLDKVIDSIDASNNDTLIINLKQLSEKMPHRYDGISVRFLRDCLVLAISMKNIEIIKTFSDFVQKEVLSKQQAFRTSNFYIRPLTEAINHQSKELVLFLLEQGACLKETPRDFLYTACKTNKDFFNFLVEQGLDLYDEREALRESLRIHNTSVSQYVIDRGKIDLSYSLEWACVYKFNDIIHYLIEEKKCTIDEKSVMRLIENEDIENMEYFYNNGMRLDMLKNILNNKDDVLNSWIRMKELSENLHSKQSNSIIKNKI